MFDTNKDNQIVVYNEYGDNRIDIANANDEIEFAKELDTERESKIDKAASLKELANFDRNGEKRKEPPAKPERGVRFPRTNEKEKTIFERLSSYLGHAGHSAALPAPVRNQTTSAPSGQSDDTFLKCILMMTIIMFVYTLIFNVYVIYTPDVSNVLYKYAFNISFMAIGLFLLVDMAFVFIECTRQGPCNFVALCLAVLSLSTIYAIIGARLETDILLYVLLTITIVVILCLILTFLKINFLTHKIYVVILFFALMIVIIITLVLYLALHRFTILFLFLLTVVSFIQIVFFIMQLQSIIEGTRMKLRDNDYALGAFMLYASLIDIFLKAICFRKNH